MHLTLENDATRPPGMNALQQQARFDAFISVFNTERPHEALDMNMPAEVYSPSKRPCEGLPEIECPFHDRDIMVTACGRICMARKKINVSTVLDGQRLGIRQVDDDNWLISFMHYSLEYIGLEQRPLQSIDDPFGTRLSPVSQVRSVAHVSGPESCQPRAPRETRTPDILITNQALYQLSYRGDATFPLHKRACLHKPQLRHAIDDQRAAGVQTSGGVGCIASSVPSPQLPRTRSSSVTMSSSW